MASTSHPQGVESNKENGEARRAKQQTMDRSRPAWLAADPFGLLSAFWGDVDRMMRGLALPALFPFPSGPSAVGPHPGGSSASDRPTWAPPLEVLTRDGEFVVRTEIP